MILVFAGAGASKAVNSNRYPTTVEFVSLLPVRVTSDKLFEAAVDYLRQQSKASAPLDIEQILWLIRELREFTSKASDATSIIGWFIQENRLGKIVGGQDVHPLQYTAQGATAKIDSLSSEINTLVYDLYGEPPSEDELDGNWRPLLLGLMERGHPLEIVTTNYDIVIEEAITLVNAPVVTGRITANQPTLDQRKWDSRNSTTEDASLYGRLTKLHGSVDWVRGKDRIYVGTPLFQGAHERHAIIYPGFKGQPQDPFFQVLHRYFQERLPQAKIALFIGYAFRDEYINSILKSELPATCKIVILNPAKKLSTVPFESKRFTHIQRGFDQEGVSAVLNVMRIVPRELTL